MGEVKVCAKGKSEECLVTYGISTCIAIMVYGTYDKTPFILMDHWDGEIKGDKDIFMRNKLCNYMSLIQDAVIDDFDPDIHDDIPIYIEKIIVMGGEKKQLDKLGDLLVSGTESSIKFLKSNLITEIGKYCKYTRNATQSWFNYLTSGNQSITVQIDIHGTVSYATEKSLSDFAHGTENQQLCPHLSF